MLQRMRRHSGLTRVGVVVIVAVVLVIAAIAVPGLLSSQRASNERGASTMLKVLSSAQADFRANDRDGNGVNDFWTADVKGLYTITPAGVRGAGIAPKDEPIRLIDIKTAAADGDDTFYVAGGENMPLSRFARSAPWAGYWFMALGTDNEARGAERPYKVDTKGNPPMGPVHHLSKFGFAAFPVSRGSSTSGRYIFRVNENNTIYREWIESPQRTGTSNPPGIKNVPPQFLEWPSDEELKKYFHDRECCPEQKPRF